MINLISLAIFLLLLWGRSLRFSNTRAHIILVIAAMVADFLLVAALVFFRDALSKVGGGMHWLLYVHIPFAILTLGLYLTASLYGWKLWWGNESARGPLRIVDRLLIACRLATLITSIAVSLTN